MVEININNRKLEAIVLKVEDLKNAKQEIRSQDFSIKKITNIIQKKAIDQKVLKSIESAAFAIGTNIATILDNLIQDKILTLALSFKKERESRTVASSAFIAPTINLLKKYYEGSNLENKVIFHSELSTKKQIENLEKIKSLEGVNIFCTPSLLPLIKENLNEVTLIDSSSRYYKSFLEGLDLKVFLERLFTDIGINLNLEDEMVGSDVKVELVEMNDREYKQKSIYISNVLGQNMKDTLNANPKAKVFLYTQRKGAYTSIVCEDCGDLYHTGEIKRETIHVSGTDSADELKCKVCDSYRLRTLGVGTTGVYEYLIENISKLNIQKENIFVIDSNVTKTKTAVSKVYKTFETSGGVLIGTELAIQMLSDMDLIGIVSLDTLMTIPDYNLDYEIYRLVFNMQKSLSAGTENKKVVFQTRRKQKIFQSNFLERDKENKKKLFLPPFYTLVSFDMPIDYEKSPSIFGKAKYYIKKLNIKVKNKNKISYTSVNRFLVILENKDFENKKEAIYENLFSYNLKINPTTLNY
jgi:primosomal protein N'